jgi:hypothetical protein
VRGRWYFSDDVSLEGVYVPVFRRGRFDQLSEATSPFNIVPGTAPSPACTPAGCLDVVTGARQTPGATWRNGQGGARFSATTGRLDWSLAAYRGFEPFGHFEQVLLPPTPERPFGAVRIDQRHPRFTMIGGDFETVAGEWGLRGEVAYFPRDNLQSPGAMIREGESLDAGIGFDRRAGNYQFSGTVLFHQERADAADAERRDVSLIVSADRTFSREKYRARAFGVYNPAEGSSFFRAITITKLRDDVALEGSGGLFIGDGRDTIGRFEDSDFLYLRLKYYF